MALFPTKDVHPWLRRVAFGWLGFVLLNGALISVALPTVVPNAFSPDARRHFRQWLLSPHTAGNDSWLPMGQARAHWKSESTTPLYTQIFFKEKKKFQYPPSSLLLVVPFGAILDEAQFIERSSVILNILSWPFLLAVILGAVVVFMRRWRAENDGQNPALVFPLGVVILACFFYPLSRAFNLGQAQTILNGLITLMIATWALDRPKFAGACLGAACLVKPQLGIIYLWACLRRRWGFVATATVVGGAGTLLALVVFGLENHLDYVKAVSFMGRHGETFHANQSVNGLMNRLLATAPPLEFDPFGFPPYHPAVYFTTLATSLTLMGLCFFGPIGPSQSGKMADLGIAVLTSIMASPIAWEHHYGSLIVVYAAVLPFVIKRWDSNRMLAILWGLSLLLMSHRFLFLEKAGAHLSLLFSYRFAGALVFLGLLYWMRAKGRLVPKNEDSNGEARAS